MRIRLDPDHDAVCQAEGRHHLVVAPPGTGKTFLSVRLAGTIAPTLDPAERVLLLTFSNQARIQLEHEATRQLVPEMHRRVNVLNYHGFFWREVWAYRKALGVPLAATIGTSRRRREAFARADSRAVEQLSHHDGVLDALEERRFERFRDGRTPDREALGRLLDTAAAEIRGGRLVFDDLGALFWTLLEKYPVADAAYRGRYPVVIADEHQDASELQDAVVRRLARKRLVVLADPMQLIYGFRGSTPERLERHAVEAGGRFELRTPHRWHGQEEIGRWLLAMRKRLSGGTDPTAAPTALTVLRCAYPSQMKARVKERVAQGLRDGMETVAVLARSNDEVHQLRNYLSSCNLYPRQVGGSHDFEEAHDDLEQLPLLGDAESVARRAIERVQKLVPTLPGSTVETVKRRLRAGGIDLRGALGSEARSLLGAMSPTYEHGSRSYFATVVALLDACAAHGHHLPRMEAVRALRATVDETADQVTDLEAALRRYSENVAAAAQAAPRLRRGLYVMTAHQAKGREFDMVVLLNAATRYFPDNEEGRRLFYVALTRATKRWVVIAPVDGASTLLTFLQPHRGSLG